MTSVVRAPLFSSSEKLTEIKWLLKKLLDSDFLKMNQAQVTPQTVVEQNRSLLRSLFKFRQESSLLSYVNNKNGTEKKYYTLAEVCERIYLYKFVKFANCYCFRFWLYWKIQLGGKSCMMKRILPSYCARMSWRMSLIWRPSMSQKLGILLNWFLLLFNLVLCCQISTSKRDTHYEYVAYPTLIDVFF